MLRPFRIVLVLALTFGLAAACGDDDPSDPDCCDPEPPGEELAPEARVAALEAVAAELNDLAAANDDPAALNAAIAAYLETRPEFADVGVDVEGQTVWAVFTDGRGVIIPNNLVLGDSTPTPASVPVARDVAGPAAAPLARARAHARATTIPVAAAAAPDPAEVPTSRRARLVHTFSGGSEFAAGAADAIGDMFLMLNEADWDIESGGEEKSTVAALRAVSGDGFFYLNTHGGKGRTWYGQQIDSVYALQTSTKVTLFGEVDSLTRADLNAGRLVYMVANASGAEDSNIFDYDVRYAFTPKFVEAYMSFSANALVFLNACESGHERPVPTAMANAFRAKNASVVLGWSRAVPAYMAWEGAKLLVDRMTGANEFEPEASPHRPFPLADVLEWMQNEGRAGSGDLQLRVVGPSSGGGFGLLRPTIERMQIDTSAFGLPFGVPYGMITIHGSFGSDQGQANRRVIVRQGGDHQLVVHSWTPDSIRVVPIQDKDAPGFSGDVVVIVRDRESNPRRLHAWDGTVTYTYTALGSLVFHADMDVVARFDPDSIRDKPGEAATANHYTSVFRVLPAPNVDARWSATGEAAGEECTITWSGGGTTKSTQPAPNDTYILHAELHPTEHEFLLRNHQLSVEYTHTCDVSVDVPFTATSMHFVQSGATDVYQRLDVSEQWELQGKDFTLNADGASFLYRWPDIAPMPVYDPAQPK